MMLVPRFRTGDFVIEFSEGCQRGKVSFSKTKRAIMFLWPAGEQDGCTRYRRATSKPLLCRSPTRRTSGVWRFDRVTGESKLLGVGDAEVAKDIYTVFNDDGTADTGIEELPLRPRRCLL